MHPLSPASFVTSGSVEEDILERAKQKMVLDHLVIQVGPFSCIVVTRLVALGCVRAWGCSGRKALGHLVIQVGLLCGALFSSACSVLLCSVLFCSVLGSSPQALCCQLSWLCGVLTCTPCVCVPPPQRMDTSGRTVLGSGGGQEQAKQMFGKVRQRCAVLMPTCRSCAAIRAAHAA